VCGTHSWDRDDDGAMIRCNVSIRGGCVGISLRGGSTWLTRVVNDSFRQLKSRDRIVVTDEFSMFL
jgi:hypothetical protein